MSRSLTRSRNQEYPDDTKGNQRRTMRVDADWASDMALLATASALLHYALGLLGVTAALAALALLENGRPLWTQLSEVAADVWTALATRKRNATGTAVRDAVYKALHRQQTWRFSRGERTRSEACTEQGDDEEDGKKDAPEEAGQANANTTSARRDGGAAVTVLQTELLRQQLLARLAIRDVASTVPAASEREPLSTTSAASTATSSVSDVDASPQLLQFNAPTPIAVENDLFVGHALFLVRTAPQDPRYVHLFAGKRRMFWIQVQGRFKRKPRGVVYLGGELPTRISLGIITKSIAQAILAVVQQLVGKVYISFGGSSPSSSSQTAHNVSANELPAVSFPLYQSVDQFMATPYGETPPPLGNADFGETEQERIRRRQAPLGQQPFDVGTTYSFHFHTMFVDLTQWKTANLPGLSNMHLTTFFDSLPLHIVAYDTTASPSGKHLQSDKRYLFNFEVSFDARRSAAVTATTVAASAPFEPNRLWRTDSERSMASSNDSSGTAQSVATYDSSPCATVVGDDQSAIADGLATVDRENARALRGIELEYLYWIEEADIETKMRRVHYVYRLRESREADEDEEKTPSITSRIVIVSAYKLRLLLGSKFRKLRRLYTLQSLRFHARARIGSYSTINDEALDVTACLQRLLELAHKEGDSFPGIPDQEEALVVAFESALYQILTARVHLQLPHDGAELSAETTPSNIGVKLSKRDREALNVGFEGVVYRFYAGNLARQEVMVITPEVLQFYRSFSSSPDKVVPAQRVIGVQAIVVPYGLQCADSAGDTSFGFALQINTFAEEIVICVATEQARNTWIRVILQHCCPHENFDRSMHESLLVCYTASKSLQPAKRVELNSRSLFPRLVSGTAKAEPGAAMKAVTKALRSALIIHRLGDQADTMTTMEFLNNASALRHIDLKVLLDRPHEERLAFFLNLYHVVLAHAMISQGFPRSQGQWEHFQTHMCYVVGRDLRHKTQPLSMSLAEIEHVILRARLPRASVLPHLNLDQLPASFASRLTPLSLAHPDFRVSFALLMNQSGAEACSVPVFEAETVHEQLNEIVKSYVSRHVKVDRQRQTIFLPRICEWFKQDFGGGGSPVYCVRKLLGFMDEETQHDALEVLDSTTLVHIKYSGFTYAPRESLTLIPSTTSWMGARNEEDE